MVIKARAEMLSFKRSRGLDVVGQAGELITHPIVAGLFWRSSNLLPVSRLPRCRLEYRPPLFLNDHLLDDDGRGRDDPRPFFHFATEECVKLFRRIQNHIIAFAL